VTNRLDILSGFRKFFFFSPFFSCFAQIFFSGRLSLLANEMEEKYTEEKMRLLEETYYTRHPILGECFTYVVRESQRIFHIIFREDWRCNCSNRTERPPRCKHIRFLQLEILKEENDKNKQWREALLRITGGQSVSNRLRSYTISNTSIKTMIYCTSIQHHNPTRRKCHIGDSCAICLDEMKMSEALIFCSQSCGNTVHQRCFADWEKASGGRCVYCKSQMSSNSGTNRIQYIDLTTEDDAK
jgi:hypothetical protein